MGFLDKEGFAHAWENIQSLFGKKQDKLSPDESIVLAGSEIGVALPTKAVNRAEYDALEDKSGLYIITDAENADGGNTGDSAGEVYSTEETRIGTWIDGKPLYRKSLSELVTGSSEDTTNRVANCSQLNIETLVSLRGSIFSSAGSKMEAPNYISSNMYVGIYIAASGYLCERHAGELFNNAQLTVSVEYTKAAGQEETQ